MSNLDVTYDDLMAASVSLQGFAEAITDLFTAAQSDVDALIGDGFNSATASAEYRSQFADFAGNSQEAATAMETLATFLSSAATIFATTDGDLAGGINGVQP